MSPKAFKISPLLSAAIVLVVVAGIYLIVRGDRTKTPDESTGEEGNVVSQPLVDKSLVEEKSYKTSETYTTFDITYPQFKNADASFNKNIANLVTEAVASHRKDSEDNWKARYATRSTTDKITEFPSEGEKFSLAVAWNVDQVNDKYISFLLVTEGFSGGAHGYRALTSFNYDVVHKKAVILKDLFPGDASYLKTVSDFARKDLEAQFRKNLNIKTADDEKNFKGSILPMMREGTEPSVDNFSVFTFTPSDVSIYFTEYQVAPYAMGESTVVIPRK
jgi:hypothetical protein